jgi:hypothetical protein
MAVFKQGQVNQILAVMVDKTDYAAIESGVTSGFTCTLYTYKQNSSTATSAVTLSRAPSVVRSGIFRIVLKSTETSGLDNALLKIAHASCAEQYIPINFQAQDISNYLSSISDLASNAYSAAAAGSSRALLNQSRISDTYSMLSDFYSDFGSRVPKLVATNSQVSDLASDVKSAIAALPNLSDAVSDVYARQASQYALLSDMISDVYARQASQFSDLGSKIGNVSVTLPASDISDIASATAAAIEPAAIGASDISDIASAVWAYTTRKLTSLADVSLCASDISDIRSAITAGGAALTDSNISDIASAVWANAIGARVDSRVLVNQSSVSNIYSLLSDFNSDFQSRVPKAVATNSQLAAGVTLTASDMSDLRSAITAGGGTLTDSNISDIASAVWAHATPAQINSRVLLAESMASDAHSAAAQANSRALVLQSMVSDVDSALTSQFTKSQSDVSDIYSLLAGISDQVSNVDSAVSSQFTALKADTSNINSVVTAQIAEMAQGIPPATPTPMQALMYLYMSWRNKTETTATTLKVHNDAGTAIAKATLSDDATTFTKEEFVSGA